MVKVGLGRVLCGLPLLVFTGCVLLETAGSDSQAPPVGVPAQIATWWQNHVVYAPDPTRAGAPGQGLAGRLYLSGPKFGHLMLGDGSLTVDLFDESSAKPAWVERWNIDPDTLKQLARRDAIGWGYTLFLPSARLKSEMTLVRLRTCYQPSKGAPQFAESVVTLAEENGVVRTSTNVSTQPVSTPAASPAPQPTATPRR
jgi:hypothetical protein